MKNIFLLSVCMTIVVAGCSTSTPLDNQIVDTTGSDNVSTVFSSWTEYSSWFLAQTGIWVMDMKVMNTLSEETKQALRLLYKNDKISFSNSYQLGDFVITNYDDWLNQFGSQIIMVVAKLNNKRVKLYEWNSGEISCSIIEKFGFPQKLLEVRYGNNSSYCTLWADYTIPQESLPFAIK